MNNLELSLLAFLTEASVATNSVKEFNFLLKKLPKSQSKKFLSAKHKIKLIVNKLGKTTGSNRIKKLESTISVILNKKTEVSQSLRISYNIIIKKESLIF